MLRGTPGHDSPATSKRSSDSKTARDVFCTASSRKRFVVVTTIIQGGFDLSNGNVLEDLVYVSGDELVFDLPDPQVLGIIVEDSSSEDYQYPDIPLSPDGWKAVTEFIEEHITEEVLDDRILETARINGEEALIRIFSDSGWTKITFL